jgi:hypothetical protein
MIKRNPVLDIVTYELRRAGVPFSIEQRGSGHLAVCFMGHRQIIPCSPGRHRAAANARAYTRRIIRQAEARP